MIAPRRVVYRGLPSDNDDGVRCQETFDRFARDEMNIRRLDPSEFSLHREVRLRALRDAPGSFGESVADVVTRPHSYWEDLTLSVSGSGRHVMFLACEGDDVVGSTYGLLTREEGVGRVGGMWVDAAWRRRGVERALLQEVFRWARGQNLHKLGLWAPAHSPAALALYRHAGFRETRNRRPLPSNPSLQIIEMEASV